MHSTLQFTSPSIVLTPCLPITLGGPAGRKSPISQTFSRVPGLIASSLVRGNFATANSWGMENSVSGHEIQGGFFLQTFSALPFAKGKASKRDGRNFWTCRWERTRLQILVILGQGKSAVALRWEESFSQTPPHPLQRRPPTPQPTPVPGLPILLPPNPVFITV